MDTDAIATARSFTRSLNILIKTGRLYGSEHERTTALFAEAWNGLRSALQAAGEAGLLMGVSGTQLVLGGVPLDPRPTDRSFAQILSDAGVSSIHFSPNVTAEDLAQLLRAFASSGSKAQSLASALKAAFGGKDDTAIRVNEVRFVAQDAALADTGMAAQLAVQSLGADAEKLKGWLEDPHRLLQLIAAAEGAQAEPVVSPLPQAPAETTTPVVEEEHLLKVFALMTDLSRSDPGGEPKVELSKFRERVSTAPPEVRVTLTEALSAISSASPSGPQDTPLLVRLAEHIAVRFAIERFERGEVRVNAVVQMLERMKREINALRKVLAVNQERMGRAGLPVESPSDLIDRQFWAELPEQFKMKVLLSPEAWAIPPRNIRQFVEQLLARDAEDLAAHGATETACRILVNYASCVHALESDARRKTATGLSELIDLYARADTLLLEPAIRHLGERLTHEPAPDLQALLGASFVRFSHEAASLHQYEAVHQAVQSLDHVQEDQPGLARQLWPRVRVGFRLQEFVDDAMRAPAFPDGLVEVLRRTPHAAVEHIASRMPHCTHHMECERLVRLAEEVGPGGIEHLRGILETHPASEAAHAVALLSRLEPATVEELLWKRLPQWDAEFHDIVVRQIALGGAPRRGKLLAKLLDVLDPTVHPEAVDEMGMCGDGDLAPKLLSLIEDLQQAKGAPYVRIKAIEALGRLREAKAVRLLLPLVEARRIFGWLHPRELRIAAAQALKKIDPEWARNYLQRSGLSTPELILGPLDPIPGASWVRQRRYERFQLPFLINGVVSIPHGDSPIAVGQLSLGGGTGACQRHLKPGTAAQLELRTGMQRLRASVLVREGRPQQLAFEIIHISLDDRTKLRRPLAGLESNRDQ